MKARCKFTVTSVEADPGGADFKKVSLEARYDESIPEGQKFSKHTPSGQFAAIFSGDVAEQFVPGREFYLDLTPCFEELPPAPSDSLAWSEVGRLS